jgi:hypothetical protein
MPIGNVGGRMGRRPKKPADLTKLARAGRLMDAAKGDRCTKQPTEINPMGCFGSSKLTLWIPTKVAEEFLFYD